jgi:hypothetical protein
MNRRYHNFVESNPRGTDAFLLASVGTTPGAGALFLGENRHRERATRRALRSVVGRRRHDHVSDLDE